MEEVGGSNPPSPTMKEFFEHMDALIKVPRRAKADGVRRGSSFPKDHDKYADDARYQSRRNTGSYDGAGWYPMEVVLAEKHFIRAEEERDINTESLDVSDLNKKFPGQ